MEQAIESPAADTGLKGNTQQAVVKKEYSTLSEAIEAAGYGDIETIQDGEIHRFPTVEDKPGNKAGWYVDNGDYGYFLDWREEGKITWKLGNLSKADYTARKKRMKEKAKQDKLDKKKYYIETAELADQIWSTFKEGNGTSYTKKKSIKTYGAKQITSEDVLLIPMYYKEDLVNIQQIYPSGKKYPLAGGRVKGCYSVIGEAIDKAAGVVICEGWATGCSLYKNLVVNNPKIVVVVAFTCHNLKAIAKYIKSININVKVIIAADNDVATEKKTRKNPGMKYGEEAAKSINAQVIYPDFSTYSFTGTDFNDYLVQGGVIELPKPKKKAVVHTYLNIPDSYTCSVDGLVMDNDGDDISITHKPVCVKAISRDTDNGSWGVLVWWMDRKNQEHEKAIPLSAIHAKGTEAALQLIDEGLPVVRGKEGALLHYLSEASAQTNTHLVAATSTGWMNESFVLPHQVIRQPKNEKIVYQPSGLSSTAKAIKSKGSLEDWQAGMKDVSPMVMFGVCAALSAPVRYLVNIEAGGFHLYDTTSRGKTTALQAAASVWGNSIDPGIAGGEEAYIQRWNATANALEAKAETFNDLPFIIDEIGEGNSREFGQTIYRIISGTGKSRLSKDASLQDNRSWRVMILSAGEIAVSDFIGSSGAVVKGGQLVRMVDIDLGSLPPLFAGSDEADEMKQLCSDNYGWAGPAMLEAIPDLAVEWRKMKYEVVGEAITEIAKRVRKRFALIAYTGYIASNAGILPWTPKEILKAVKEAYAVWHSGISIVSDLDRAVEAVRGFILKHQARFYSESSPGIPSSLAGYERGDMFHFLPDAFKEACNGVDPEKVKRQLKSDGLLHISGGNRLTSMISVSGQSVRVVSVKVEILSEK